MNGLELKKLLKLNYLNQQEAADLFNVSRETVNRWCSSEKDLSEKTHNLVISKLRIKSLNYADIRGNSVINSGQMNDATIDQRQYFSDSPDVLRTQIEVLDERIKEKDAQIKEKDAQISRLLGIIEDLSKK